MLRVASLDEAVGRWTTLLGLHGEAVDRETAVMRCTHEDFALVLKLAPQSAGLDAVCYELAPGVTLAEAARAIVARGGVVSPITVPLRGEALATEDPDGNCVQLVPRVRPEDTRPAEVRHSTRIPGWHPRKLGHVNYLTADVQRQVRWYTEVLGFAVTDWIGDEGVWLHVNA